jgi:hypothetical protein
MAGDDSKTSPAPKSGAAEKKEVAAKKRGPAEEQDQHVDSVSSWSGVRA